MGWQNSWTICKSFAPCCRHIITPVPHHLVFLQARCPSCCPTVKAFTGNILTTTPNNNCFMALFPEPPGWAGARREVLDFMVQGKINRGRHTDHPAGRHSIRTNRTNQCPPPHIFYRPDALPAAQPTVSKHWRQYCYYTVVYYSTGKSYVACSIQLERKLGEYAITYLEVWISDPKCE